MKALSRTLFGIAVILAISSGSRAFAVPVTFSGGNNTPLSVTLLEPVTYQITGTTNLPYFVIEDVGNPLVSTTGPVSGSISFTINNGSPIPINAMASGPSGGDIVSNDLLLFNLPFPSPLVPTDVVILSAGTVATSFAVHFASPPLDGDYNTFIASSETMLRISNDGTVGVPDSLSTLWLALPLVGMLAVTRLRRLAARFPDPAAG